MVDNFINDNFTMNINNSGTESVIKTATSSGNLVMGLHRLYGNLLISNDLLDGMTVVDGKVTLCSGQGLGVIQRKIK